MIIHWYKNRDYHVVRIYRDLVGDWIVEQSWGNPEVQNLQRELVSSYREARTVLLSINRQLKAGGFKRTPQSEVQLDLLFE